GEDTGRQADAQREWGGDGGELDAERHGGHAHASRHLAGLARRPGDGDGDGDGGDGGDDCGEQSDQPDGDGGHGGGLAAVGDREGREREPGGAGGGDVRGGPGERDDYRRQSDDQRERGGDGGELDAERHGGPEYPDGDVDLLVRQPRDVHGFPYTTLLRSDCGEQSDQPVGDGGHGGQHAAVGDREGCERESGGGSGGDVHP